MENPPHPHPPPPPTLPPTQAQADAPYRIICEVGGQTAAADRTAFESWCVRAAGSSHQSNKWNTFLFFSFKRKKKQHTLGLFSETDETICEQVDRAADRRARDSAGQ